MATRDRDLGRKRILKNVVELKKRRVRVGFWGGMTPPAEGGEDLGPNFATIMFFNEFGTETIPPRPAMRQAHEKHRGRYMQIAEDGMAEIYEGRATARNILTEIAFEARGDLTKELMSGGFTPNAPATIERKKSSKPLFEDGHLAGAVLSEIE